MLRLKAHSKPLSQYSEIDKYFLVPKKNWGDFEVGKIELKINGKGVKTRVYDILCDCIGQMHNHRIVDLREVWEDLKISDNSNLKIEK